MRLIRAILIIITFVILLMAGIGVEAATHEIGVAGNLAIDKSYINGNVGYSLHYSFIANNFLKLRSTIYYNNSEIRLKDFTRGDYSLFGIEGSVLFNVSVVKTQPYIGFGVGYYKNNNWLGASTLTLIATQGVISMRTIDYTLNVHFLAGMKFAVSKNIIPFLEIKHIIIDPKVNALLFDLNADDMDMDYNDFVNLNSVILQAGLIFKF